MALWDNIQGKWRLANTTYTDESGNGYTLSPGVPEHIVAAQGHDGGANLAAQLDETFYGSYLSISDAAAPNLSITGNITVAGWIKPSAIGGGLYHIIVSKHGASGNYSYDFFIDPNGKLNARLSSNGTTLTYCVGATALSANTLHHVAFVYDGTDIRIYLDSSLDTNGASNPKAYTSGIYNGTAAFEVGRSSGGGNMFSGTVDDLAVFNRALSASEIQDLYVLGDDWAVTPKISGVIKDKSGTIINCSTYSVRVNVYPKNNSTGTPLKSVLVTSSNGRWAASGLVAATKYIAAFEYEGKYIPAGEWDIAGAEFKMAS